MNSVAKPFDRYYCLGLSTKGAYLLLNRLCGPGAVLFSVCDVVYDKTADLMDQDGNRVRSVIDIMEDY